MGSTHDLLLKNKMDYPGVEIVHVITKNLNPNFAENAPCNRPLVLNTPFKNCLPICLSNYAPPPLGVSVMDRADLAALIAI